MSNMKSQPLVRSGPYFQKMLPIAWPVARLWISLLWTTPPLNLKRQNPLHIGGSQTWIPPTWSALKG